MKEWGNRDDTRDGGRGPVGIDRVDDEEHEEGREDAKEEDEELKMKDEKRNVLQKEERKNQLEAKRNEAAAAAATPSA